MNAPSTRYLLVVMRLALRKLKQLQDRLLHLLGSTVEGRPLLVTRMLERNANESTSYWLQLCVSIGIATLGLVVGSAAVIIGAMLVAPARDSRCQGVRRPRIDLAAVRGHTAHRACEAAAIAGRTACECASLGPVGGHPPLAVRRGG